MPLWTWIDLLIDCTITIVACRTTGGARLGSNRGIFIGCTARTTIPVQVIFAGLTGSYWFIPTRETDHIGQQQFNGINAKIL